jgi:hypothetical protein
MVTRCNCMCAGEGGFAPSDLNCLGALNIYSLVPSVGREVREQAFERVSDLLHDLDEGMLPISVLLPYLPIPAHFKRDK